MTFTETFRELAKEEINRSMIEPPEPHKLKIHLAFPHGPGDIFFCGVKGSETRSPSDQEMQSIPRCLECFWKAERMGFICR